MRTHKHKKQFMITAELMGVGIQIWHGGGRALPLSAVLLPCGFPSLRWRRRWPTMNHRAASCIYSSLVQAHTHSHYLPPGLCSDDQQQQYRYCWRDGGYGWPLHCSSNLLQQANVHHRFPLLGRSYPACTRFCALLFPASQRLRCIV